MKHGAHVIAVGIDETDWCDSCGSTNASGVLFNPGKPSLRAEREGRRRNFAVCSNCLVSAMRVRMPTNPPIDRGNAIAMVLPIIMDEVGALVWYAETELHKALYLDRGEGCFPGDKLCDLPVRTKAAKADA